MVEQMRITVHGRSVPAVRRRLRVWMTGGELLLLCELLVLVREVLRVSVNELRVRYVVRQRDEAIATFIIFALVTPKRSAGACVTIAVVAAVRLVRLVMGLAVLLRTVQRRVVGRGGMRVGHGAQDCDMQRWMQPMQEDEVGVD